MEVGDRRACLCCLPLRLDVSTKLCPATCCVRYAIQLPVPATCAVFAYLLQDKTFPQACTFCTAVTA
jgi:hypothetical protein